MLSSKGVELGSNIVVGQSDSVVAVVIGKVVSALIIDLSKFCVSGMAYTPCESPLGSHANLQLLLQHSCRFVGRLEELVNSNGFQVVRRQHLRLGKTNKRGGRADSVMINIRTLTHTVQIMQVVARGPQMRKRWKFFQF